MLHVLHLFHYNKSEVVGLYLLKSQFFSRCASFWWNILYVVVWVHCFHTLSLSSVYTFPHRAHSRCRREPSGHRWTRSTGCGLHPVSFNTFSSLLMRHSAVLLGHQGREVSAVIQRSEVLLGFSWQPKEPEGETDLLRVNGSRRDGEETRQIRIRHSLMQEDR